MLASELVLSPAGAIYHLNLHPEQIADTIFLVGDPGRVPRVSKFFDKIEHQVQKREFVTHTGFLGKKRISVLSTGIGTDNIDIVLNELDALVNIDLQTRTVKESLTSLNLIRLGTSGSLSAEIPVGELVTSAIGIGLDNLMHYYGSPANEREQRLRQSLTTFAAGLGVEISPSIAEGNQDLINQVSKGMRQGITLTCPGFYGPQGRTLRLGSILKKSFFENIGRFEFEGLHVTNFEMETAAIFGLSKMLGHRAASCNAILANRITGEFSKDLHGLEEKLIKQVLGEM